MVFPTAANAVLGSVALSEAGIASGTNSALRQLGGVFGVAVLAAVFAGKGVYDSPAAFIDGFSAALWAAVGLSALGTVAAAFSPRRRPDSDPALREPALAFAREAA